MRRLILMLLFAPAMASAYHNDLMSTGDVDGDGDIDLIRVANDGTVYTMDVNGGDRRSFATMAPATPGDTRSSAESVGSLPDMNSNGSREILLSGHVAHRTDRDSYLVEEWYTEIWDPLSHALLYRVERESSRDRISIVRDLNGDGYPDLVRSHSRDGHIIETLDPITGLSISEDLTSRWHYDVILSGPHGLGVLVDRAHDLSDLIEFRDPHTSQITQRIWIGGGHVARDALSVPDLNGNWSREWAVLRTTGAWEEARTSVLVLDSRTKEWIRQVRFTGWAQPHKLMFVNGTDVAVFSRFHGSGAQPLEVRNARTGTLVTRTWFPKHLPWSPGAVTRVDDINGNGSHEVAVIGDAGDDHVTIIKDTRSGKRLRWLTW